MPTPVVDVLEEVDVEHQGSQRRVTASGAGPLPLGLLEVGHGRGSYTASTDREPAPGLRCRAMSSPVETSERAVTVIAEGSDS